MSTSPSHPRVVVAKTSTSKTKLGLKKPNQTQKNKTKQKKKVEKRQRCLYRRSVVLSLRHAGCCDECNEERRYNTCFSLLRDSAKSVFATTWRTSAARRRLHRFVGVASQSALPFFHFINIENQYYYEGNQR